MGFRGIFFLFYLSFALFISACAERNEPPSSIQDQPLLEYVDPASADKYACAFGPQEGETALLPSSPQIVETTFFRKQYDGSVFAAVARASIEQTYLFVSGVLGLDVFRVKLQTAKCRPFSFLQRAPLDLIEVWKATEAAILRTTDEGNGQLASNVNLSGMYLPRNGRNVATDRVLQSTLARPAILIPDGASRWNLIHEMMHHLFDRRRLELGYPTLDEVRARFSNSEGQLQEAMKSFDSNPSLQNAIILTNRLSDYSQNLWITLTDFQLEEVTIESLLIEKFADKTLAYFPDTLQSSRYYINIKASQADMRLKRVTALSTEIRVKFLIKLGDDSDPGSEPMVQLDKIDSNVSNWRDEIGQSTGLPMGVGGLSEGGLGAQVRGKPVDKNIFRSICSQDESFMDISHFPSF